MALPGMSFSLYYLHLFPEYSWYYEFRSLPGTEFLTIFIGIAGGLAASLLPRVCVIVPLYAAMALCVIPTMKTFVGPIPQASFRDRWKDQVCLQSTSSTCGAASLATVLKHFGAEVTEAQLASEAHSYVGGTEAWYLARCARSRGYSVRFSTGDGLDPDAGFPAIVGVRKGFGHFIPVLGRQGNGFVTGDPLVGREVLSLPQLTERYELTGFRMTITKETR
jgi:predicted double-glycine peptidase